MIIINAIYIYILSSNLVIYYVITNIYNKLYINLIYFIIQAGYNNYKYKLNNINSLLKYHLLKDLYKNRKISFSIRKFIIFIKNRISQKLKKLNINKNRKFGIYKLKNNKN